MRSKLSMKNAGKMLIFIPNQHQILRFYTNIEILKNFLCAYISTFCKLRNQTSTKQLKKTFNQSERLRELDLCEKGLYDSTGQKR
jgi:hypothetical protein